MIWSYPHMTLQFTFIWQLWYCHIHIWLSNLPSYSNYDIVTFTYDFNLPSYNNYDIVTFTCNTSIYLHMTTMALSHSHTARTARFSKKSPWSVFFRGEMSVICHKITVKCRWNHGETFTAKINKLGPKWRWNILIAGDNTAAKIIRVYTYM